MNDGISQAETSPKGEWPEVRLQKQTMAETAAFPFQFSIPGRNIAQFGISFRHLAALHIMSARVVGYGSGRMHENQYLTSDLVKDAVFAADALAAELDRTEGRGNNASEDTALLDHFEKHFCQPCQVNGGPDDGREGKAWVLASHGDWTLREAIRIHKAGVEAGEIETREG